MTIETIKQIEMGNEIIPMLNSIEKVSSFKAARLSYYFLELCIDSNNKLLKQKIEAWQKERM